MVSLFSHPLVAGVALVILAAFILASIFEAEIEDDEEWEHWDEVMP